MRMVTRMRISKDKSLRNNKFDKTNDSFAMTAGGTVNPYRLVYKSSGKAIEAAAESSVVVGASQKTGAVNNGALDVFFGNIDLKAGSAIVVGDKLKCCGGGRVSPIIVTQADIGTGTAGNFANQPAGDGVEIVSDSASDITQTITIYGTKTGATDTVTSETVTLTGTDAVSTVETTWQTILGIELSAACAGTITIREASANATIITIAAGTLSAGIGAVAAGNGYGSVVRIVAGGASTKAVGIMGLGVDGSAVSAVAALNGATEKNIASTRFGSVTKILIGDVATGTVATVKTAAAESSVTAVARALESGALGDYVQCFVESY